MFKYLRKVKSYIYSLFFRRKLLNAEECTEMTMKVFEYSVKDAALNLSDAIDKEILKNLYSEKIFDTPLLVNSPVLKEFEVPPPAWHRQIVYGTQHHFKPCSGDTIT